VKYGLQLFGLGPQHYPTVAAVAEEHGFESVWMPEHLVLPEPLPDTYLYTEGGRAPITSATPLYDPWVVLAAVAQATESIRLATNVFILPLRHPIATARSVVTLDRVSRGRVTLGMGVGWLEGEFDVVGESFRDRGRRADEIIPLLRRLWSDEVIEHHGEHYDFGPIRFEPKPRQRPSIPIEVGGCSSAALRRAGRLGDGWIEIGAADIDVLKSMIGDVQRARADAGREGEPFEITCGLGRDVDAVRRCRELGVTRVLAGPPVRDARVTADDVGDWIRRFADDVIAVA
jgi:probable F420-dependent oxidoreductase